MKYIYLLILTSFISSCASIPWDAKEPEIIHVEIGTPQSTKRYIQIAIITSSNLTKVEKTYFGTNLVGEFKIQFQDDEPIVLKLNSKLAEASGTIQWRDIEWSGVPFEVIYPNKGIFGNAGTPSELFSTAGGTSHIQVIMTHSFSPDFFIPLEALKVKLLAYKNQEFQLVDKVNTKVATLIGSNLSITESLTSDQVKQIALIAAITRIQNLIAQRIL